MVLAPAGDFDADDMGLVSAACDLEFSAYHFLAINDVVEDAVDATRAFGLLGLLL